MKTRFLETILITITMALILLGSFAVVFAQPEWTLQVNGAVSNNLSLTMDQLAAIPTTSVQANIYCYGVFVTGGSWTGARLSQILQMAGLEPQAESVGFTAADGYTVTIPLTTAMHEDVIVAYQINGQPLSEVLRLVLPEANGNMWIGMITQITVTASPSNSPQPNTPVQPNFNVLMPTPMPTPTPKPTRCPHQRPHRSQTTKQPLHQLPHRQIANHNNVPQPRACQQNTIIY